MYELMIKDDFSAAHSLRHYSGKCEHLHGHNYIVELYIEKEKLDKTGLAVDFVILKKKLKKILNSLDHKYLNKDCAYFKKNNPSAENIAKFIYDSMKSQIKGTRSMKVCVNESENARACYYE